MIEKAICPWCGTELQVVVCDDEGNIRDGEYELNPISGLSYGLYHPENDDCLLMESYSDQIFKSLFETPYDAVQAWNNRLDNTSRVVLWSKSKSNVYCCEDCGKVLLDVYRFCPDCGKKLIYKGKDPELWEKIGEHGNHVAGVG